MSRQTPPTAARPQPHAAQRAGPGQTATRFDRGDFVLVAGDHVNSRLIRFGQRLRIHGADRVYVKWTHAALIVDAGGGLIGINTATSIRGTTVVIPAGIAWAAAQRVLEHGQTPRGYLGVLGQAVTLSVAQAATCGRETAVLVIGVAPASAAAHAGLLVGDIVLAFDETSTASPEDLHDVLAAQPVGRQASLKVLRGNAAVDVPVTIGERPNR
jgi:membrane-associated protease RseP (regulator of RpoE activity)